jgi:hypothetical protein
MDVRRESASMRARHGRLPHPPRSNPHGAGNLPCIFFSLASSLFVFYFFLDRDPDPFLGGPLPLRRKYRSLASLRSSSSVLKPGITWRKKIHTRDDRSSRERYGEGAA